MIRVKMFDFLAATNYTPSTINFKEAVSQGENTGKYTFYKTFNNDCCYISMNSTKKQIQKQVIYLHKIQDGNNPWG